MTLQPLQLDDLNWRTMVDAIRGRIAAVSDETWTLHAAVDPGVTLLELFAYLLEQRVYWLDQVPDTLISALVALLAAERRPAVAATTLLEVTEAGGASLAAGSIFQVVGGESRQRVSTVEPLDLLNVVAIDVTTRFGKRSARQSSTPRWAIQPLTLLPVEADNAEVQISLWLSQPPVPGTSVAFLIELDGSARIPPGWATDAVADVDPPADLEWSYSVSTPDGRTAFGQKAVHDGTQGMRRSGRLRVTVPADWSASGPAVGGLSRYVLWLRNEEGSFAAPPRLVRIIPNVVAARHGVAVAVPLDELKAQFATWLPLPGLTLSLSDDLPPIEPTVELKMLGADGESRDWKPTWDFARHGPEDSVFEVDRIFNCLRFANGLTGRLPVPAKTAIAHAELTYFAGGGIAGNLGTGLQWERFDPPARAVNPVPVSGGAETETAAETRDRLAADLLAPQRAVTAQDYETLACATPGVGIARAKAVPGFHPSFPCVDVPGAIAVFIVPEAPRGQGWIDSDRQVLAPRPDRGMLSEVRARLDERRMLTVELFVLPARYRMVEVQAALSGAPPDKEQVAKRIREGLTLYLDPLVGASERKGWPFGQSVRPSEIAHELQQLAGEAAVVSDVAVRLFDPAKPDRAFTSCEDADIAPYELVALQALDLRWAPPSNRGGGLK